MVVRRAKFAPEKITTLYEEKVARSVREKQASKITRETLHLITAINDDMRDHIGELLRQGIEEGLSVSATASKLLKTGLDKGVFRSSRARAWKIAKTELHRARQAAALDIYEANGISILKWVSIFDGRICDDCLKMSGRVFKLSTIKEKGWYPPLHVSCRCRLVPSDFQLSIKVKRGKEGKVLETKIAPSPTDYKYIIRLDKKLKKSISVKQYIRVRRGKYETVKPYIKTKEQIRKELTKDAVETAKLHSISADKLVYAGLQSFAPLSDHYMHLWNIDDPSHEEHQSTVTSRKKYKIEDTSDIQRREFDAKLQNPVSDKISPVCPRCGAKSDSERCPRCGTRIDKSGGLEKARPYIRTRRGRLEHVKGYQSKQRLFDVPFEKRVDKAWDLNREDVKVANRVAHEIHSLGGRALIAGGFVRDSLLGRLSKDIDIEVYGVSPDELRSTLERIGKVDAVGASFGVLKLKTPELEESLDISIPRRDSKIGAGHKGFVVEPDLTMTVKEAASRRDLTINALSYDPISKEIIDDFGGIKDIKEKRLSAVYAETFVKDPLRALRVMQFAGRFGFSPDVKTALLCRQVDLTELPKERIYGEFEKLLLKSKNPSIGLMLIPILGINKIMPELDALRGVKQDKEFHPEGSAWNHTLMVVEESAKLRKQFDNKKDKMIFMLAALLHDIGKPETTEETESGRVISHGHESEGAEIARKFLERFTDETDILDGVENLVANHMAPTNLYLGKAKDSAIRRLARKIDIPTLVALSTADKRGRDLKADLKAERWLMKKYNSMKLDRPETLDPKVMGRHLIQLGIQPGPEMGRILKQIYEGQLEGKFDTTEGGLEYARERGLLIKGIFNWEINKSTQVKGFTRTRKGKLETVKPYYRGFTPGRKEKINTGVKDWDKRFFVTDSVSGARLYGEQVEKITFKPTANILVEGEKEFKSLSRGLKGKSLLDWANEIVNRAEKNGYDVVHFSRQTDLGTVVINKDAISKVAGTKKMTAMESFVGGGVPKKGWQKVEAEKFVAGLQPFLKKFGYSSEIVGSVSRGKVYKEGHWDLDVKLTHLRPDERATAEEPTYESIYGDFGRLLHELGKVSGISQVDLPDPGQDEDEKEPSATLHLKDGRVVDFYEYEPYVEGELEVSDKDAQLIHMTYDELATPKTEAARQAWLKRKKVDPEAEAAFRKLFEKSLREFIGKPSTEENRNKIADIILKAVQVKGFTRVRRGRYELVKPYSRLAQQREVEIQAKRLESLGSIAEVMKEKLEGVTVPESPKRPFYSMLEKLVTDKFPLAMPGNQIRSFLVNHGIKEDEIKWTKIDQLFNRPRVTKQEIQSWVADNSVKIIEIIKVKDASDQEFRETKFAAYMLEGGKNYRELLFQLPVNLRRLARWGPYPLVSNGNVVVDDRYESPHWDEPNILAHVRFQEFKDKDGNKVLMLEEVQSDWHQAGRKSGYNTGTTPEEDERYNELGRIRIQRELTDEETLEITRLEHKHYSRSIPDAPFKNTWQELCMRRMLHMAAEDGFDKLAWTTGEQQAARYDLSKQVDAIRWTKTGDVYNPASITVEYRRIGSDHYETANEFAMPSELDRYVGKDIAKKILESPLKRNTIQGLDLKIGGEGMKGFYDKILVDYANKLGKQYGVKVGETELTNIIGYKNFRVRKEGEERHRLEGLTQDGFWVSLGGFLTPEAANEAMEGRKEIEATYAKKNRIVHSLDITPKMRGDLAEGTPLFKSEDEGTDFEKSIPIKVFLRRRKGKQEWVKPHQRKADDKKVKIEVDLEGDIEPFEALSDKEFKDRLADFAYENDFQWGKFLAENGKDYDYQLRSFGGKDFVAGTKEEFTAFLYELDKISDKSKHFLSKWNLKSINILPREPDIKLLTKRVSTDFDNAMKGLQLIAEKIGIDGRGKLKIMYGKTDDGEKSCGLYIPERNLIQIDDDFPNILPHEFGHYLFAMNIEKEENATYFGELSDELTKYYLKHMDEVALFMKKYTVSDPDLDLDYYIKPTEQFARVVDTYVSGVVPRMNFPDNHPEYLKIVKDWGDKYLKTGIIKSIRSDLKLFIDSKKSKKVLSEFKKSKLIGKSIPYKLDDKVVWAKVHKLGLVVKGSRKVARIGGEIFTPNLRKARITAVGKDGITARTVGGGKVKLLYKNLDILIRK